MAGVSRATVSASSTASAAVQPTSRARSSAAIATTGYVPNLAARSLVTRRTGAVIVVVSRRRGPAKRRPATIDFADPFFGRVVGGHAARAAPARRRPVLTLAETDTDRARVLTSLRNGNAAGALLVSTRATTRCRASWSRPVCPPCMFARPALPIPLSFVDVANRDGARLAAEHLVARGCRHVAAISGPLEVPSALDRSVPGSRTPWPGTVRRSFPSPAATSRSRAASRPWPPCWPRTPTSTACSPSNDLMALGAIAGPAARPAAGSRRRPRDRVRRQLRRRPDPPRADLGPQPIEEMAVEMARILLDTIAEPDRRVTSVIFEPTLPRPRLRLRFGRDGHSQGECPCPWTRHGCAGRDDNGSDPARDRSRRRQGTVSPRSWSRSRAWSPCRTPGRRCC